VREVAHKGTAKGIGLKIARLGAKPPRVIFSYAIGLLLVSWIITRFFGDFKG